MIKRIDTYIVTDGNGQEAVNFYKNVFDAELVSLKL
ncbi:VOC family protein, partial [Streptococcus suis]